MFRKGAAPHNVDMSMLVMEPSVACTPPSSKHDALLTIAYAFPLSVLNLLASHEIYQEACCAHGTATKEQVRGRVFILSI